LYVQNTADALTNITYRYGTDDGDDDDDDHLPVRVAKP
jgi:hypothetical protein